MSNINRRDFLWFVAGGAALAVLSRCVPGALSPGPGTPLPTEERDATGEAPPAGPTAAPKLQLLRNENRAGFYIRYYKPFPPVDIEQWALAVEGMVRYPQRLTFQDIQDLPVTTQTSRMKCVEGWSAAATWEGFRPEALVDKVEPYEGAEWVHFYSADGYYESLALGEFLLDRVLFVYRMNDALLLPEYGAPLRLIVPAKYGYKGPKAITRIVFADKELRGYWPTVGPYSTEGEVQPGYDYPLDLGGSRQVKGRGEIFYEDGLESMGN